MLQVAGRCISTGHRNVYVGIHVPYSRTKHKHRSRRKHSNGQGRHGRSHRNSSEACSTLEEGSVDTEIESLSLGEIEESRRASFHGVHSDGGIRMTRKPSYHKSMSAPSSRPRTPPNELDIPPTIIGELIPNVSPFSVCYCRGVGVFCWSSDCLLNVADLSVPRAADSG